jgi:hypothetical protein
VAAIEKPARGEIEWQLSAGLSPGRFAPAGGAPLIALRDYSSAKKSDIGFATFVARRLIRTLPLSKLNTESRKD